MIGSSWWALDIMGCGAAISNFTETRIKKFAEFDVNASSKMCLWKRSKEAKVATKVGEQIKKRVSTALGINTYRIKRTERSMTQAHAMRYNDTL